jgi:hypothetical protein
MGTNILVNDGWPFDTRIIKHLPFSSIKASSNISLQNSRLSTLKVGPMTGICKPSSITIVSSIALSSHGVFSTDELVGDNFAAEALARQNNYPCLAFGFELY